VIQKGLSTKMPEGTSSDVSKKLTREHIEGLDGVGYMKRLEDRERPVPRSSPLLLQPLRPNPPAPTAGQPARKPVTLATPASLEEQERMKEEYYLLAGLPATKSMDSFSATSVTEVVEGRAWVVPALLSPEECQEIIRKGEEFGMTLPKGAGEGDIGLVRNSRRTNEYMAPWMTQLVAPRLPEELLAAVETTSPHTAVRGVHTNWRVAYYGPGQTFPAHFDNSDTITLAGVEEGTKELCTSSHTLLIYLSPNSSFSGGATRLFLSKKYQEDTLDIKLPQGYGLVFQQKGLLHAGLEVRAPEGSDTGCKYIAQAGVLRGQGELRAAPSLFKYGPGLDVENVKKQMELAGTLEGARVRAKEVALQ